MPFFTTLALTDAPSITGLPDIGADGRALDHGLAENDVFTVDHSQNLVELDAVAGRRLELLDEDDVAFRDTILLTAGYDDSMLHE